MKLFLTFCAALSLAGVARAQTAPLPTPIPAPTPTNEPPVDYAGAIWVPAAPGNFSPQNRPQSEKIDMIVVHDIEGPASAGINIFQRPGAGVSAHYIVGGDGTIWQMVREHNVGWHAGNRNINHRSIGIETEGYAYRPGWYSTAMYESQARLVRDITRRHNIPRDRTHIISHAEVPNPRDPTRFGGGSGHTDPGPYWNWALFMTLIRNDARVVDRQIPATIRPGEVLPASVTLQNTGDDLWPANTARNPNTALQASGPIVVLATEQGRVSPLSHLRGWISPTVAAGAATDTLPGAPARFEFTLRGPRQLGELSDQLRLTTMPTAAQGASP
ncbi:MAG: N-acetylmuramoyl-L-alanine amidase, partial [Armatimonadetes bacterium]|nr:N-acetylmuramoyl-L-alanine amidase [Armatimonadota bacterium]